MASKAATPRGGGKAGRTKKAPARVKKRSKTASRAKVAEFSREEDLTALRLMLLARRFEEKAGQLYGMGHIGGFCHLYIGQEAVAAGVFMARGEQDDIVTSYRCHAHELLAGADAKAVMAELTGRAGGVSRGKGGSMHMFHPQGHFWGGHGIVGAQVPIGTGLAFANSYSDNGNASLVFFGEGAANQGQVYESFNMASLWKLPVVYIIENNRYAMGTSVARAAARPEELYMRGASFGIPGEQVDGMDVRAVFAATRRALDHARSGKGPYILEMRTYRYRGHSMSDPAKYRTREEVQRMRQEYDPIEQVKARLMDKGWADEAALKEVDAEVRKIVQEAADFATADSQPAADELWHDLYARQEV